MKILKKICFICLCILLTGCCNENKDIITIKFSTWGSASEMKIITPIISEFEKENPNIKIELLHIPQDYFKKLHLLFASNLAPDVIFINNLNLPVYKNLLTDLSPVINNEEYYPQALKALSSDDKIYAVPRDISVLVIYYNKTLFNKMGVSYPKSNWDMEDLISKSKQLTSGEIKGIGYEPQMYYALPYIKYYGGEILSENGSFNGLNQTSYKGLNLYKSLAYKYHIAPTCAQTGSKTVAQMFLEGKIAMHLSGRWLTPKYRECAGFDWDVINFPHYSSPADASGWAVSKSSKHKDAAIKFVQFLSKKENIEKMTADGLIVPARKDVANSKVFLKGKPNNSKVFIESVINSEPTRVSKDYNKIIDKLTNSVFND